jgi:CubicO group peptidase (beta-lactamase class C family)
MRTLGILQKLEVYDITSCLIHYRGELLYHYEQFEHASARLMPINSCTKSVLSALVCIALDKGLLPSPDALVCDFFPMLRDDADERKQTMTVRHLLTMTAGFQWNEFGGSNSFPKMTRSPNWIQFVLEQPLSHAPGTKMVYNSGVSQLLAGMLAQAAETTVAQFAEEQLFGPLSIEPYEWKTDPQGIHTGGFGLQLAAHDMLKFGLLYLRQGMWNGRKIIPPSWVRLSVEPAIAVSPPEHGFYGWHWWMDAAPVTYPSPPDQSDRLEYYYARGFGGQFIFVVPACETVIVFTRKRQQKGLSPHDLFRQHLAPLLPDPRRMYAAFC